MNLGLYRMKYPLRRAIGGLCRLAGGVRPDVISWSCLPLGIATAGVYCLAPRAPALYVLGILLILARMVVTTLDGLIAETTGQSRPAGELVNRIPGKVSDVLLVVALAAGSGASGVLAAGAMGGCWLASYASMLGPLAGVPGRSTGPAGQTDRLAATIVASLWALGGHIGLPVNLLALSPTEWLLGWFALGGAVTFVLRTRQTLTDAAHADPAVWRAIKAGRALGGK